MEENNLKSAIEALIFASERPVTLEQLKKVLGNPEPGQLRKIVEELKGEYEAQNRGFRIAEIAGGFQMITASG
ncbi:MAG: SMC-Scp complex subunit ScpB, partial [Candidatus Omnitrophica bacterium]|nr:SMC-Scp complex subunit ScpB [Candidatus Omnitrophota bacterium]